MKHIREYVRENGDIPDCFYQELPADFVGKRFGFTVNDEGIVITANDYPRKEIMIDLDDDNQFHIHTSDLAIAFAELEHPDAKSMYLAEPSIGTLFSFKLYGLARSDFKNDQYLWINGQPSEDYLLHDEIGLCIFKDSVIKADLHGIDCSTLTFRRQRCFERLYEIIVDVEGDALPGDFTVSAESLVQGVSLPILADALKPQSLLIDRLDTPYFHRELVFTKDADGKFSDYHVKNGVCAIQDVQQTLSLDTTA